MRLLTWDSHNNLALTKDLHDNEIPRYAILSHTWGADSDEVTFADLQQGGGRDKVGFKKILFCGEQAQKDSIQHFWVDTCCIDKTNATELSEAITSMYRWYRSAAKCYVYLSDVPADQIEYGSEDDPSAWEDSLRTSRWFTRGWTLQELLAPDIVEFFSRNGVFLGTKRTLAEQIHEITTLPLAVLYGTPPAQFPIAERWRWAHGRQTKRKEDKAYCLFGIFGVFLPLIYGEGDHAFHRLEQKVAEQYSGVNDSTARSKVHTIGLFDSRRSAASKHQVCVDDKTMERPPKRYRTGQHENHPAKNHSQSTHEVRDYDEEHDKDRFESLLESLLFDRIELRINNVKKAFRSTCDWLLRHPHFQTWYSNSPSDHHNGFLWIKGKPGCGKSTLMKAAFDWVPKKESSDPIRKTVVPYFFHGRASNPLQKSSLGFYRTVAYHLLSAHADTPLQRQFMTMFRFKDPRLSGDEWTVEELQQFLINVFESEKSFGLCLFIDALDEAEHEDDARQMIAFLIELSERASAAGGSRQLQICLSSRHHPHISIGRGLSLVVEEQLEHGQDIEIYINKQLTCLNGPEKDLLRAMILRKSARIFLWVVLVVEMLNKLSDYGTCLSEMQSRLDTIPADLHELFQQILLRNAHSVETSVLLFQWVVFSKRPMEPNELFFAIEYSRFPTNPAWDRPTIDLPSSDRLALYILNNSRGMVEIVQVAEGQPPVVQFIHETIREFMLKDNGLASILPANGSNAIGISHNVLRVACDRCISATPIPDRYRDRASTIYGNDFSRKEFLFGICLRYPFLDYAVSHLTAHAEVAQRYGVSQEVFLKTQVDRNGLWLDSHRFWWNMLKDHHHQFERFGPDTTLLHFIVERQCFSLVAALLKTSNTLNKVCEGRGTALQVASAEGITQMVRLLLNAGADTNAQGGRYGSALQAASSKGHEKVVQMLIDASADVNARGGFYGSAIQAAAACGRKDTVQTLINARANVNIQGGCYTHALLAAVARRHEQVVQILIDAGADVDAQGKRGTALQEATSSGHKKILQMLVNANADINARGGLYASAIEMAAARGHKDFLHVLIGVRPGGHVQGGGFGNALQFAATNNHTEVVQILINAGADIDARGGLFGSAIQAASKNGHENLVQVLIDAGADVDMQEGTLGNALHLAVVHDRQDIVRMLINAGADVNARGGGYGSAVEAAVALNREKALQMLMNAGADLSVEGELYSDALQAALSNGYTRIAEILRNAAASVKA